MTIIQPSGISGITSITALGNDFNIFRSDGSKALNAGITTDAYRNTLGGLNAGDSFTLGSATDNTLLGYDAGTAITTGDYNTSVGSYALQSNTTGSYNTASGMYALILCNGGSKNTAVGFNAGGDISTGNYNVCIGVEAGHWSTPLTTGKCNIHIGYATGASAAGVDHEMVITVGDNGALGKGANTGFFDDFGQIYQSSNSSSWATTSDIRIKKNIVNNNIGLSVIEQLQVKNFEYKTEEEIIADGSELVPFVKSAVVKKTGTQIGLIAQELEAVCPGCVKTESTGVKSVVTDELFWHMLNAIKELSAQVKELQSA